MWGCQLHGNRTPTEVAIADVHSDSKLRIASVDGKPAKRLSHPIHTVLPRVLVEPGTHTFTLEGYPQPFTAELEPGKNYETLLQDGTPTIVDVAAKSADPWKPKGG
jgi:hypothetical protein